jgi:23S rRNA (uracil1939-C5)-methyltransferase
VSALTLAQVREASSLTVTIEGYGHTGEGFVRLEDGWLSVRNTLPGERVVVSVEPGQSVYTRRLFARVDRVIEGVAERGEPECEQVYRCRGCHLRVMTLEEERRWKLEMIAQVIERYAGLAIDEQPPVTWISPAGLSREVGERIRTSLTYAIEQGAPRLGMLSPGHEALIQMGSCAAITEGLRELVARVQAALERAWVAGRGVWDRRLGPERAEAGWLVQVRAAQAGGEAMVVLEVEGAPDLGGVLAELRASLSERCGLFVSREQGVEHVSGPAGLRVGLGDGVEIVFGPQEWFHATLRPANALYEEVIGLLGVGAHERFLDLGCGVGTLSLKVASRGAQVVGVDASVTSVERATQRAAEQGLARARFMASAWERAGRRLLTDGERFEVASVNPMREPVGERALAYLAAIGVERVVYLGPSAVAAAKDIGALRGLGWRLDYLGAANLHPATYHVMLVARLVRMR